MSSVLDIETTHQRIEPISMRRWQWADLARDVAMLAPEFAPSIFPREQIEITYALQPGELDALCNNIEFSGMVIAEVKRLRDFGERAGHVHKMEAIVDKILMTANARMDSGDMEPKEVLKFLEISLKSIGRDTPAGSKGGDGISINAAGAVQIVIPPLSNPKLDHLRGLTHE